MVYGDNRRRYHRVKVKLTFKISQSISEQAFITAYTRDLSMGGACIETNHDLPSFCLVKLFFELPDKSSSINIEGRVLWSKEIKSFDDDEQSNHQPALYLAGIQFLNLHTAERKQHIQKLMELKRKKWK